MRQTPAGAQLSVSHRGAPPEMTRTKDKRIFKFMLQNYPIRNLKSVVKPVHTQRAVF